MALFSTERTVTRRSSAEVLDVQTRSTCSKHQQVCVVVCLPATSCVGLGIISLCIIEPRDIYRRVSRGWQLWLPADPQLGALPTKGMWHTQQAPLSFYFLSLFTSYLSPHNNNKYRRVVGCSRCEISPNWPYTCGVPIGLIRFFPPLLAFHHQSFFLSRLS